MSHATFATLLEDTPWRAHDWGTYAIPRIPSMICADEALYLHWLVRTQYTGAGEIVDGGPLLGGSTVAMAEGLRQNDRVTHKAGRIHSYDLFEYNQWVKSVFRKGPEPAIGENLLPRFLDNTRPWQEHIQVYPGDVTQRTWTGGPIEILFVDFAKSWDIWTHVLREFFPHLIPGVSTVVHQDYFFASCYWLHLVMESLADYFEPVHMPDGPTLAFKLVKPLPADLLKQDYERLFSTEEATALMDRALARFAGTKRLLATTAKAVMLLNRDDIDGAVHLVECIRESPDFDRAVEINLEKVEARIARRRTPPVQTPAATAGFIYRRPKWGRGMITEGDAAFLHELIIDTKPTAAVEIGVASGCSSVAILAALGQVADTTERSDDAVWLHSFDVRDRCYFDETKATGAAVAEFLPHYLSRFSFTQGNVLDARRLLTGRNLTFALIDAHHYHPWPTADLLGLLPVLAPEAWVVLHDIRLPLVREKQTTFYGYGPMHLYEMWPGEKRRGGDTNNIGAIRMPANLSAVPGVVARVFEEPWETTLPDDVRAALSIEARPIVKPARVRALQLMEQAVNVGRPLYVWGAGEGGQRLLGILRDRGVTVSGIIDRDATKHGASIGGVRVSGPDVIALGVEPRPYLGLSGAFASEIASTLNAGGWTKNADYAVL